MHNLGKRMQAFREEKGLSLEEAGEELNIRSEDLLALEEEDFTSFPDRQFAVTVLNLYADFLGMDKEEVNQEFSQVWPEFGPLGTIWKKISKRSKKEKPRGEPLAKKRSPLLSLAVIMVVVLGAFVFWQAQVLPEKTGEITGGEPHSQGSTVTVPSSEELPDELSEPEPSDIKTEIVEGEAVNLEITTPGGECWLEVVADGEQVYYLLVPRNTKPLTFTAHREMSVLIGDAAAARIKCNGEDLGVLGERAVVIKRIFRTKN